MSEDVEPKGVAELVGILSALYQNPHGPPPGGDGDGNGGGDGSGARWCGLLRGETSQWATK